MRTRTAKNQKPVIEVPNMDEDVAIQLLQRYLPDQDLTKQEQYTKALLIELTYLSLAIV